MMRFTRLFALLTVLLMTLAVASPAMGKRAASGEVPIKGTVIGGHVVEDDPVPAECAGFDWKFSGLGTGKLSHLGKVDFSLEHCTTSDSAEESHWEDGTITFTAPNGDTLRLSENGEGVIEWGDTPGPPLGFTYEGEWVVDGGTGRFSGATGSGHMEGYGTIPGDVPDALVIHFDGTINYNSERPFRGAFSGDEVDFNFDVPQGRCVEMADVADSITTFSGEGMATHMGPVTIVAEHCSDIDTGQYGDGRLTITADNGDVLKATYTSGVSLTPPPLIEFEDEVTFVDGGTGRFAHASGHAFESGVFNFDTNEWSVYAEGIISYSK